MTPTFVIKTEQLAGLNYLASNHPRPQQVEWINRGTDQKLRRSSVDMLLRTMGHDIASPSVVRLHRTSGLRLIFKTEKQRSQFSTAFEAARHQVLGCQHHVVTGIFDDREQAERAVSELKQGDLPEESISLLWRASPFMSPDFEWPPGHKKRSVAGATASGAIAASIFGVGLFMIPGIGPVAVMGPIAEAAMTSLSAFSAIIGATGGAIAKMLTDYDVDSVSAIYCQQQVKRGKIFVSVDTRIAQGQGRYAKEMLRQLGGRTTVRG